MIANPLRWLKNVPFAATNAHTNVYPYQPTPQVNNRVIYAPTGKVLGGSGSVNAMVWAQGHRDDYDRWASFQALAGRTNRGRRYTLGQQKDHRSRWSFCGRATAIGRVRC